MDSKRTIATGTYSRATLRYEDLIPTALDLLRELGTPVQDQAELLDWCEADYDEQQNLAINDWVDQAYADLCAAINYELPRFWYYGCTEGDGSDIGIWAVSPFDLDEEELPAYREDMGLDPDADLTGDWDVPAVIEL